MKECPLGGAPYSWKQACAEKKRSKHIKNGDSPTKIRGQWIVGGFGALEAECKIMMAKALVDNALGAVVAVREDPQPQQKVSEPRNATRRFKAIQLLSLCIRRFTAVTVSHQCRGALDRTPSRR